MSSGGLTLNDILSQKRYKKMEKKMKKNKNKSKYWMCIIELDKASTLPTGFDSPPRLAAVSAVEKKRFKVKDCWSGWGMTKKVFDNVMHEWNKG